MLSLVFCLYSRMASVCALLYTGLEDGLPPQTRFVVSHGSAAFLALALLSAVFVMGTAVYARHRIVPWLFVGPFGLIAAVGMLALVGSLFVDMAPPSSANQPDQPRPGERLPFNRAPVARHGCAFHCPFIGEVR